MPTIAGIQVLREFVLRELFPVFTCMIPIKV